MGMTRMAQALFDVLDWVLPDEGEIKLWTTLHRSKDRDGYALLHQIFCRILSGFSNTDTLTYPEYAKYTSIPGFAAAVIGYYRLPDKCGNTSSDIDRSILFLNKIDHPGALSLIPQLLEKVEARIFNHHFNDKPVECSHGLTVKGLAVTLSLLMPPNMLQHMT